jgi:hypothetical protein
MPCEVSVVCVLSIHQVSMLTPNIAGHLLQRVNVPFEDVVAFCKYDPEDRDNRLLVLCNLAFEPREWDMSIEKIKSRLIVPVGMSVGGGGGVPSSFHRSHSHIHSCHVCVRPRIPSCALSAAWRRGD